MINYFFMLFKIGKMGTNRQGRKSSLVFQIKCTVCCKNIKLSENNPQNYCRCRCLLILSFLDYSHQFQFQLSWVYYIMVWVRRDLRDQPCCHGQGHLSLDQITQRHIQAGLEHLQGGDNQNFSGQAVPLLHYPHSKEFVTNI